MGVIREKIGDAAMYEMLAEECSELAQAALKYARIIRRENPTPVSEDDAHENLIEEFTDVIQCAEELDLRINARQMFEKQFRFLDRWESMCSE